MKPIYTYVLLIVVGILLGIGVCRNYYVKIAPDVKRDTTYIYEKVPYSRLDLGKMSVQLSIPEVNVPNIVFMQIDSTTIIYKDSVRYVVLPRQYYFTSTEDVEIWHSGIDSTIDSLNVVRKAANITNTYKPKEKKNYLAVGMDVSWCVKPSIPIYLEYTRMLHRNVALRAGVFHDLAIQETGFRVGVNANIGW